MKRDINQVIRESLDGDIAAKEELILRLKPIVISSIRRYYNRSDQYDDLIQDGYEVILKSISTFDQQKNVHFLGYIKAQLRYYYLDRNKSQKNTLSLNQPIGAEGESLELLDTLEDEGPSIEALLIMNEKLNSLRTSLSNLTQRQREVVEAFYLKGSSIGQISKNLGISYRTVINIKTKAMEKLAVRE